MRRVGFGSCLATSLLLGGCDLLLLSPTTPGVLPGVGVPLTGKVLDSQTGLPIGKAAVLTGFGFANTDNAGDFALYGDVTDRHCVTIARAGYVTTTYEQERDQLGNGHTYLLDPLFPTSGGLSHRDLNLTGTLKNVDGSVLSANGNVSFGGLVSSQANQVNGSYALKTTAGLPGNIFSGILSGGQFTGSLTQAFNYLSFGYRLVDIPSTLSSSAWVATADVQVQNIPFSDMIVTYNGLAAFSAPSPQTEVTLDFGMLGSVLVGRGYSSNQTMHMPQVDGAKYVVTGVVTDSTQQNLLNKSEVSITTNMVSQIPFNLLAPPKILGPADNTQVGSAPRFSWKPVASASNYYVVVTEQTGGSSSQVKWKGYTNKTSINYPNFWMGDSNGAGLYKNASYSWSVHARGADSGFTTQSTELGPMLPSDKPYRSRRYESSTSGMRFWQ